MQRRAFTATLLAGTLARHDALAQAPKKRPHIAWLAGASQAATTGFVRAFLDGMRELGYVESQHFDITYRFADGFVDRLPGLAAELIKLNPDVIVAAASANAVAVRKLTSTIPIVVPALGDPIALGLIESERHPGGNVTGVTPYIKGLPGKQFELAREVKPGAVRIGVLNDASDVKADAQRQEIEAAGVAFKARIINMPVARPDDIEAAMQKLAAAKVQVVIVLQTNMFLSVRKQIATAALAKGIPTVFGYSQHVEDGGLISYGVNLPACFRLASTFVDKILKGVKPGDLPVQFPTRLEMAINMKTAKLLNLKIDSSLIYRADKVIE